MKVKKTSFLPMYKLIQTFFDQPEIIQVYQFMQYLKFSCLDLQFVLPKVATKAKVFKKPPSL